MREWKGREEGDTITDGKKTEEGTMRGWEYWKRMNEEEIEKEGKGSKGERGRIGEVE